MASGFKRMVINTQERAISVDINRLQRFKERDIAELFRYYFDVLGGSDDLNAGGVITQPNLVENPLRGEIVNGLMVRPQVGSLNLFVDSGAAFLMSPDAAPDESNYKFVNDAGIGVNGVLLMTANASGSTRIDVIECRLNPTDTTVTDNRDIFNPITGLFVATSITKELAGRLEYRVRLGTPAGGFPGTASGWMPLAVAHVPDLTTTNDTITFWDVRPLLNDREFSPFNLQRDLPQQNNRTYHQADVSAADGFGNVLDLTVAGVFEGTYKGRRIGGRLQRGTPGTDAANVVLGPATTANNAAGFVAPGIGGLVFFYLLFPGGLPRWARYTDSTSGERVPRGTRGIIVVSTTPPRTDGSPSAGIALPAGTDLGATDQGLCWAATFVGTTGPTRYRAMVGNGRRVSWSGVAGGTGPALPTTNTLVATTWTLTAGTHFPTHAKRLLTELGTAFTTVTDGVSDNQVQVSHANSSTQFFTSSAGARTFVAGGATLVSQYEAWMDMPPIYPVAGTGHSVTIRHQTFASGGGAPSSAFIAIRGFEF